MVFISAPMVWVYSDPYSIYLGPKVIMWEPLWALCIYYIPAWTLRVNKTGLAEAHRRSRYYGEMHAGLHFPEMWGSLCELYEGLGFRVQASGFRV